MSVALADPLSVRPALSFAVVCFLLIAKVENTYSVPLLRGIDSRMRSVFMESCQPELTAQRPCVLTPSHSAVRL